ncbi:arylamine N-acetyltransferase [Chengkuizengella axinellae]|uniref:Arylamine N-acetyltransferase n=1 Tax=Chengkuizengella axinellae TaxID=3064388 RepID=A0ABT9J4S5_9BACL|nr:arylamine N-acetyltransferase [Chengkuizengella sp. 2205SS18-9]MDP5276606.1 arylamine N-acetyltransferase [Chengkuizengella sp. 2205SS18-9]
MNDKPIPNWVSKYLEKLYLSIPEKPSYEFLTLFSERHLSTLPFENVSKLIYFSKFNINRYYIPSMETYVESLFKHDYGGTCYVLNQYAHKLLSFLGYDCSLVNLDRGHIGILVKLPEFPAERLYLDVGAAAPILKPVRFENKDNSSKYSVDEIQILPDAEQEGYYRFTRYRNEKFLTNTWIFNPNISFSKQNLDESIQNSFKSDAFFMTKLRVDLFQLEHGRILSLNNNKFTIRTEDLQETVTILNSIEEVESVIDKEFGLSKLPVRKAVEILKGFGVDIFET